MFAEIRFGLGLGLVAVAAAVPGCGDSSEAARAPARPAEVTGTVTKVDRPQDGTPAVVIDRGEACALVIYVDGDTKLLRDAADGEAEVSLDELSVGQKVEAWVGAIAESCPEQTQGEAILVIDAAA